MREIRIGVVGAGWMGTAHSTAFKNAVMVFGTEPAMPVLEMVADVRADVAEAQAAKLGFRRWTADWHELVADPAIDVVDVTATNDAHPEIAIAAAKAGKHVYCEKPLANSASEAKAMLDAVEAAGVTTLVGFNYLKNPVVAHARELVRELGPITLFRGTFDLDLMADPSIPFSWRHDRKLAGTGALGDTASHVLAFALSLVGDIDEVVGQMGTFIHERPLASSGSGQSARAKGDEPRREVENEDVCQFLLRFASGTLGVIESSRVATGRKLWLTFELQGTKGSLCFTQERMNELQLYRADDPEAERGYKLVQVNPGQPRFGAFHPIPGVALGYNDQKIIEARELIEAIATGRPAWPDFRFGWQVARVIDAVERSVAERRWVRVDEIG